MIKDFTIDGVKCEIELKSTKQLHPMFYLKHETYKLHFPDKNIEDRFITLPEKWDDEDKIGTIYQAVKLVIEERNVL